PHVLRLLEQQSLHLLRSVLPRRMAAQQRVGHVGGRNRGLCAANGAQWRLPVVTPAVLLRAGAQGAGLARGGLGGQPSIPRISATAPKRRSPVALLTIRNPRARARGECHIHGDDPLPSTTMNPGNECPARCNARYDVKLSAST